MFHWFQCKCACDEAPVDVTEPIPSLSEPALEPEDSQIGENSNIDTQLDAVIEANFAEDPPRQENVEPEGSPTNEAQVDSPGMTVMDVQNSGLSLDSLRTQAQVSSLSIDATKLQEAAGVFRDDSNATSPSAKRQETSRSAKEAHADSHGTTVVEVVNSTGSTDSKKVQDSGPNVEAQEANVNKKTPDDERVAPETGPYLGLGWKINNKLADIEARFAQFLMSQPGTGAPQNFEKKFGWKVNDALERMTVSSDRFRNVFSRRT